MTERSFAGKDQLRVAYILHRFPHQTETFIVREMTSLRDEGVEVSIYSLMQSRTSGAPDRAGDLLSVAHFQRFMSWSLFRSQLGWLGRRPGRYLAALRGVIRKTYREPRVLALSLVLFPKMVRFAESMKSRGVQHVHAHFAWIEGIAAGVATTLVGIPHTTNPHAFGLFTRHPQDVRRQLEDAVVVTTISSYNKRFIENLCPNLSREVEIIRCGVELDKYPPRGERGVRPDGPLRILSVGRAVEKKGHQVLIDACRSLADSGLAFECKIVAGTGGLRAKLASQVESLGLDAWVHLMDSLPESDVRALLVDADVFVLACVEAASGDRDGIPVVLMEAMACELPVVTTAVSGIPELVGSGVHGLVVPPGDAEAIASAVRALAANPSQRLALGQEGRKRVGAEFSVRENAEKLRGIFEEIVNRQRLEGL